MSQTNRVVRHKTNARKNYTKPLRQIVVYGEDEYGNASTCRHEAESLRAALHQHAEELSYATDERIVVGNVMSFASTDGRFVAIEL